MNEKKRKGVVGYHGESLKFNDDGEPFPVVSEYVEVRDSGIHGKGVFAIKDIPKGTKVIEYVGEKITKKESEKRCQEQIKRSEENSEEGAVYVFELDGKYDLDGNFEWNPARLVNHSCSPNCETEEGAEFIWIIAIRDIKAGEEISYNYGYDFECYEDHLCKCGSENCIGYIVDEDHWDKVRKKLGKKL